MSWTEYLREISLLILLNRSNSYMVHSQPRRASIPSHLMNAEVVSQLTFFPVDSTSPRTFLSPRRNELIEPFLPNISYDEALRKHAKLLQKLNERDRQNELKRKQMGPSTNFRIMENINEEQMINLPKLKVNARDDRKAVTDPWTSVKEMQQLRNSPVVVQRTRARTFKV